MKVCEVCYRINPDDAEVCIECARDDCFLPLSFTQEQDDIQPYLEDKNGNSNRTDI